ncbi:MAG: Hsp20/alpha crystallin family protein [Saprospiraceae bacterium]
MTLVKRNSNHSNFPKLFDDFSIRDFFNQENNSLFNSNLSLPMANIFETDTAFLVELAVPGMSKKDFQIELDNENLKITGERKAENEMNEEMRFIRREYNYQSFQRSFHLSKKMVDASKIEANYKEGILQISIPKKEEAKVLPPRTIKIK